MPPLSAAFSKATMTSAHVLQRRERRAQPAGRGWL